MKYNVRTRKNNTPWPGRCKYCPRPAGFGRIVCRECAYKRLQDKNKKNETEK